MKPSRLPRRTGKNAPATALDLAAVFVFALTGGLVASRAQLDLVGFLFLACLTGIGGGTLRDLVLGRDPVFWVGSPHYLGVASLAAILVFFTAHLLESRYRAILWIDALALSVATAAGVTIAREAGASWPIVLVMGVATGTFGGMMRDVVANEIPLVLRQGELYVSACLGGAVLGNPVARSLARRRDRLLARHSRVHLRPAGRFAPVRMAASRLPPAPAAGPAGTEGREGAAACGPVGERPRPRPVLTGIAVDRLDCDRMFVAVVETGSFVAAAARHGTSSGQASKLVARLEAELGVRLLNRTTRAVSATEAGQAYFDRIRPLLDEYESLYLAVKNISQSPRGRLRITAPLRLRHAEARAGAQ